MIIDMLRGAYGDQTITYVVAFLIAIAFSISIHEFAHGYVANKLGDDTAKRLGRLSLNPLAHIDLFGTLAFLFVGFGWAKPVPINPIKFKEYRKGIFLVSIAGIVANIFVALFSAGAYVVCLRLATLATSQFSVFITSFLQIFFYLLLQINLSLAIFNLIPIFPLDGFNVIFALTKQGNKFVEFLRRYGNYLLIGMLVFMTLIEPYLPFLEGGSLIGYLANLIARPMLMMWSFSIFSFWVI